MKKYMEKGYLAIVLHAHLPFVRHPEHSDFLEEDWFFEALTETYIPLLQMMDGLERDGVDFRLTLSLSPTLLSMMLDPLLQERYLKKLAKLIELSAREIERTAGQPAFQGLARRYHDMFSAARQHFTRTCRGNLVQAFNGFQERGRLEIITCAATHAYLPLLKGNRPVLRAQIETAVAQHRKLFGQDPRGIWLPECGFEPGIDEVLKDFSLTCFFVDTHGILHASPRPRYGVYAPLYCPSGVAAFGRDSESAQQVWSSRAGYPGDGAYRDFYRDIGFDLDYDYIRPYLHGDGIRASTGIKYYRITGETADKAPYDPEAARIKAHAHAEHFMASRRKQAAYLYDVLGKQPVITAPYDAELFGHWWFEGPQWLDFVLREAASDQTVVRLTTPSEYLARYPDHQVAMPALSSWGWKGYSEVWLEESNDWIYRHLHAAGERMVALARKFPRARGITLRALNQAARELMLAQSSDWAFIMKTQTLASYAVQRTKTHLLNFNRLWEDLLKAEINEQWLAELESRNNLFPDIDYRVYA